MTHPLPCPFCGYWESTVELFAGRFAQACANCEATGPRVNFGAEALARWNRRASIAMPDAAKAAHRAGYDLARQEIKDDPGLCPCPLCLREPIKEGPGTYDQSEKP